MKMNIFKPLAIAAVSSLTFFGCAGSSENTSNTETGVYTEDPVITEDPVMTTENQELSNSAEGSSSGFFENVDNTDNYDVFTLVKMDNNLSTFAELLEQSGLDNPVGQASEAMESITIFAPTNEAFENMPQGELDQLRDPQNQVQLVQFIQRHIVPSEVPLIQFSNNNIIETSDQGQIPIDTEMNGNSVTVGGALIIKSDVGASNGLIHVVDGVVQESEFNEVMGE